MLTAFIWLGCGIAGGFLAYCVIDLIRGLRDAKKEKQFKPLPPPIMTPDAMGPAKWEAMVLRDIRNRRPQAIDPLKWEAAHAAQLAQMRRMRNRHRPKKFQVEFIDDEN